MIHKIKNITVFFLTRFFLVVFLVLISNPFGFGGFFLINLYNISLYLSLIFLFFIFIFHFYFLYRVIKIIAVRGIFLMAFLSILLALFFNSFSSDLKNLFFSGLIDACLIFILMSYTWSIVFSHFDHRLAGVIHTKEMEI
jgi:hypothetical protein